MRTNNILLARTRCYQGEFPCELKIRATGDTKACVLLSIATELEGGQKFYRAGLEGFYVKGRSQQYIFHSCMSGKMTEV